MHTFTAFGESCSLPIPEIVAIGGQSDGKSSLLEAFLGVCKRVGCAQCFTAAASKLGYPTLQLDAAEACSFMKIGLPDSRPTTCISLQCGSL